MCEECRPDTQDLGKREGGWRYPIPDTMTIDMDLRVRFAQAYPDDPELKSHG